MTTNNHHDDNNDASEEDEEEDDYYNYYDREDYVLCDNDEERPHSARHLRIHPSLKEQIMNSTSSSRRRHKRASSIHRVNTTGHDLNSLLSSSSSSSTATNNSKNDNQKKPSSAKFQLVNRFSLKQSTEQMFRETTIPPKFIGTYGHLRRKLDYGYHSHYQKQRQWLHDAIIEDSLLLEHQHDDWSMPVEPQLPHPEDLWVIFMVGLHGSGKHFVVRTLSDPSNDDDDDEKLYRWKLLSYVCIDTDDIRRYLPEYSAYVDQSPDRVDALTRKECGYIGETLLLATLQAGRNAIVFGNLKDVSWYKDSYLPFLRNMYPNLRFAIVHVTAAKRTMLYRSRSRAILTGRTILEQDIEREIERIPKAVEQLKPCVDYTCTIRNEEREDLQIVDGGDWITFQKTFDQTKRQPQQRQLQIKDLPFLTSPASRMERSVSEGETGRQQRPTHSPHYIHHYHHHHHNFLNHETKMDAFTRRRSYLIRRRFSTMQSTEDNYRADHVDFYGDFAHIRQRLDYSYHSNYTFERQRYQDAIIREFLNDAVLHDKNGEICTTPTHPWIVFTAGAMGAGKSYTLGKLVKERRFPLLAFVRVDPDSLRRCLPEWHLYNEQNPELAGQLTMKEAGYMAEILTLAGLQAGKNVIVDGSLRRANWYREYFAQLREEFPELRIAIIHVTAPRDAVFRRAAERALVTGRVVPQKLLAETIEQVPLSVAKLAPLVDYHVEIRNAPNQPDVELVTPGETWESFTATWVQECAWVPKSKAKMLERSRRMECKIANTID